MGGLKPAPSLCQGTRAARQHSPSCLFCQQSFEKKKNNIFINLLIDKEIKATAREREREREKRGGGLTSLCANDDVSPRRENMCPFPTPPVRLVAATRGEPISFSVHSRITDSCSLNTSYQSFCH